MLTESYYFIVLGNKIVLSEKTARISAKANGHMSLCLMQDHGMRVCALYLYLIYVHESELNY